MAGVRKKPRNGKYQGWYFDSDGRRKFVTGTRDRRETQRIAEDTEGRHRKVSLGYAPRSAIPRTFADTLGEYLAKGERNGGRNKKPWGKKHRIERQRLLEWWASELGIVMVTDLLGSLASVERTVDRLLSDGLSKKTVNNYVESIHAFSRFCFRREYLDRNPLTHLEFLDSSPEIRRRDLSLEEIGQLLVNCRHSRKLLYLVALTTGLRAGELGSLHKKHLSTNPPGLHLDANWTKNRKDGFQPLPAEIANMLREAADKKTAENEYQNTYARKKTISPAPDNPLLYVPSHPARDLACDLRLTGIKKVTDAGKMDFHALRTTFITLVDGLHATFGEVTALARHSHSNITYEHYVRPSPDALQRHVESLYEALKTAETCHMRVIENSD